MNITFPTMKMLIFQLKQKIYVLLKNVQVKICEYLLDKQFSFITYFRILQSLIKKWNFIFVFSIVFQML